LSVKVADTGVGIPDAEQAHIFREFYRVDRTRGQHEGLGLGLTIVKRLCDLIEASVEVASVADQGTVFTVTTPYRVVEDARLGASPSDETPLLPADPSAQLTGRLIAIVEDDAIILDAYRQMLASRGAHVVVLPESEEALMAQLAQIDHIDCILCDYRLQHNSGDVMIEKLRENYNRDIPAVIVTADTSPAHIHRFERLNVPVLYKPVTHQTILATIQQLLTKAQATL